MKLWIFFSLSLFSLLKQYTFPKPWYVAQMVGLPKKDQELRQIFPFIVWSTKLMFWQARVGKCRSWHYSLTTSQNFWQKRPLRWLGHVDNHRYAIPIDQGRNKWNFWKFPAKIPLESKPSKSDKWGYSKFKKETLEINPYNWLINLMFSSTRTSRHSLTQ